MKVKKRHVRHINRVLKGSKTPYGTLWRWARKPRTRRGKHLRWTALVVVSGRKAAWHRAEGDKARKAGNGLKAKSHYAQARAWRDRRKVYRRKRDATKPRPKPAPTPVVSSPGDPHWGGCRAVTDEIVRLVAGRAPVTSRKRTVTFGNPGSDHFAGNVYADAVDFGIANAFWLRNEVMRGLGVVVPITDYGSYYIERGGLRFRVQPIASTHGTGPHLHMGVRRA